MEIKEILATFGIEKTNNGASTGSEWINTKGEQIDSYSPVDGSLIASVSAAEEADYEKVIAKYPKDNIHDINTIEEAE